MLLPGVREWGGLQVDLALPVGRKIPGRALQWLKQFSQRHGRPLLYLEYARGPEGLSAEPRVLAHGPPEFQREIIARLQRGEALW